MNVHARLAIGRTISSGGAPRPWQFQGFYELIAVKHGSAGILFPIEASEDIGIVGENSKKTASGQGNALATAMLPPGGKDRGGFRIIIVAASNADPYPEQDAAIAALGAHFGPTLDRHRCFPYGR